MSKQLSNGNALEEWKEARAVIARFDENLHDLRKYGFSFVTALLAANGLFSVSGASTVSAGVKASVLVVTMGLIVTLKLLDTHYRRFQRAAATRGRILEDRLNLDLTTDLSLLYKLQRWWRYAQYLYYGFLVLTTLLGLAILWNEWYLFALVVIAAVLSLLLIRFINSEKEDTELEDWSLDRKIVTKGTPVRITYTNLNGKDRCEPSNLQLLWKVIEEPEMSNPEYRFDEKIVKTNVQLKYFENYDWLWETENKKPGLYEILMSSIRTNRKDTKIEKINTSTDWTRFTIQVIKQIDS